jgi:hypothetical protein
MSNTKRIRIAWEFASGTTGNGEWVDDTPQNRAALESFTSDMSEKYKGSRHWIEEIEQCTKK